VTVDRRGLLGRLAAAGAALFGLPGLAALLDPALRGARERWIDAGPLAALAEGEARRFTFPVAAGWETRPGTGYLVRAGDRVIALDATCTHAGCAVRFRGGAGADAFLCPCHGGTFALDGAPRKSPVTRPLARFETRVEDGHVKVRVRA
jgi:nitrite reductase/ring-hydroxylating ferredoxin subunit